MSVALLIFPHQLFDVHPGMDGKVQRVLLVEEPLFFDDPVYPLRFHKQKIAYHRTTIIHYLERLRGRGVDAEHIKTRRDENLLTEICNDLAHEGISEIRCCEVHDFILNKRLRKAASNARVALSLLPSPGFLTTRDENGSYRAGKKRWFMADYYKWQRSRLNILIDDEGKPEGGRWSFDDENRKKVPKKLIGSIPFIPKRTSDPIDEETRLWVEGKWPQNPGFLKEYTYPVTHEEASVWLDTFLRERFHNFGPFEDAVVEGESWLWHSVLTPMLNIGLLTPDEIVERSLAFGNQFDVPINSLEGFVRQVIGWREFMSAAYDDLGIAMRKTNHWNHHRPIPPSFYEGTTGIGPIDDTIRRINDVAYCHHIERLMVLGVFMFLCEFDPDEIYRWFMEMFIDAYDWVMVPNVYAMSQNADGGLITTKPYFSGSAYIRKMSHWDAGEWSEIWDALYWRFIHKHASELAKNPRWSMMCAQLRKMDQSKLNSHLERSENYLKTLNM